MKFYKVKPCLQVERDAQNNAVLKATIIYLPDLAHPQYLSVKEGLGSKKLDRKLAEGLISTLGISIETKLPIRFLVATWNELDRLKSVWSMKICFSHNMHFLLTKKFYYGKNL